MTKVVRCSAPGRGGIVGNPSDMYGGSVISCSTQERAHAVVEPCDELVIRSGDAEAVIRSRADLVVRGDYFDIGRVALAHMQMQTAKVRLSYRSDVPFQAGLSGSTALLAACLKALMCHAGQESHLYRFAEVTRGVELNRLGIVCGYQDAYMATFGHLNFMDFRGKEHYKGLGREPYGTVERLNLPGGSFPFVFAHTGVRRVSGEVHKPIRERWLEGERLVVESQARIGELAREGKFAFLERDWERLGHAMNQNHAIQRKLGGSGPENETLIKAALDGGALGAKLAGAGGGGTIVALHPTPQALEERLLEAGSKRIMYPLPSDGVRVDEVID